MRVDEGLRRLLGYVGGWAVAELLSGLFQHPELVEELCHGVDREKAANLTGLTARQAGSLLETLRVEQILDADAGVYRLTEFGEHLEHLRGWMDLFVRGYGAYFHHAEQLWDGVVHAHWRDMREVGLASVRISEHGALPLATGLIQELVPARSLVMDVGCANGRYLVRLCELLPGIRGIGIEPSATLYAEAKQLVHAAGFEDRIAIVNALAQDYLPDELPDFVIFAFVLQELAEQVGTDTLVRLLTTLGARCPEAWFLVIEVDVSARERVEDMRRDPYLRGYYNHYYLLHDLTDQRLLTFAQWRVLFERAGFAVERQVPIDPVIDPTGLECGFLMRFRDTASGRQ
jgi:2-ketoarginine methyltransferase